LAECQAHVRYRRTVYAVCETVLHTWLYRSFIACKKMPTFLTAVDCMTIISRYCCCRACAYTGIHTCACVCMCVCDIFYNLLNTIDLQCKSLAYIPGGPKTYTLCRPTCIGQLSCAVFSYSVVLNFYLAVERSVL